MRGICTLLVLALAWPGMSLAASKGSVALSKVVVAMSIGDSIGEISSGEDCSHREPLIWRSGKTSIGDAGYAEVFRNEAEEAGYPRLTENLFDEAGDSDFAVAGKIRFMKVRACLKATNDGVRVNGDATVDMEWQVYSRADEAMVATVTTSGDARIARGDQKNIVRDALLQAFADSARALVRQPAFIAATMSSGPGQAGAQSPTTAGTPLDPLILAGALSARARPVPQSGAAVVAVFTSVGMGSGFLVSKDGDLFTNAHVVGKDHQVKVRWSDGTESQAMVLRVEPKADVALIQVAGNQRKPLALRQTLPSAGDDVWAIGTPLEADLQGTLSRGIVSAIRTTDGATLIQSDVSITHGNSGGPLLDAKGNVVGMTVSGLENTTANLNFFIPVAEILKALNLKPGA